jgi:hypothetical protein
LNAFAFLALDISATAVVAWGEEQRGGNLPASASALIASGEGVSQAVHAENCFAVVTASGGAVMAIKGQETYNSYTSIVSCQSNENAFTCLTNGEGVIDFGSTGNGGYGGIPSQYISHLSSSVTSLTASVGAFAAL